MFDVRAAYVVEDEKAIVACDRALVEAAGMEPAVRSLYRENVDNTRYRLMRWTLPGFGQAVALKDALNRMSGVNATVRER